MGALLCLAIGGSFAGIALLIGLPNEHPMDRWHTAKGVITIAVVSSTLVGFVAGAASRASLHGLPLIQSVMVVAVTTIAAIGSLMFVGKGFYLSVSLGGVVVGGIVVALAGIIKAHWKSSTKQEDQNTAGKA